MNINTIREMAGHEDERTTFKNYCFDRSTEHEKVENMVRALSLTWHYNLGDVVKTAPESIIYALRDCPQTYFHLLLKDFPGDVTKSVTKCYQEILLNQL